MGAVFAISGLGGIGAGLILPALVAPIVVMQMFGMRDYPAILGPVMAMLPAGVSVGTPLWGVALDATGSYTLALLMAVGAVVVALLALLGDPIGRAPARPGRPRARTDVRGQLRVRGVAVQCLP